MVRCAKIEGRSENLGTCSRLATLLDAEMLERRGISIAKPRTATEIPPPRPGRDVAAELGGRFLLRYLGTDLVGAFIDGTTEETYTTPTPYSPDEAIIWLNLPSPTAPRTHVMLLDPAKIEAISGPMYVGFIAGIQYILPHGFPKEAIVVSGAPGASWEHVVS